MKGILEALFQKNGEDLSMWFWNMNCEALKMRYLEVLDELKMLHEKQEGRHQNSLGWKSIARFMCGDMQVVLNLVEYLCLGIKGFINSIDLQKKENNNPTEIIKKKINN